MRQRTNNIQGSLSAQLTAGATTINGTALAGVPTLTLGDDYYPLTIDQTEIVYITVHTSSATSATIVREKEGTTDVTHADGLPFVIGPTALDFMGKKIDTWLDFPKHTPHAMDDDFSGGADGITLDPKWTTVAVSGSPVEGEIDPYVQESSARWEVRDGSLWVSQWGASADVQFRQDDAIDDGECIIMKCNSPVSIPNTGGIDTGTQGLELTLNSTDSDALAGVELAMRLWNSGGDTTTTGLWYNGASQATMDSVGWFLSYPMYLRIARYGDKHFGAHSHDGRTWTTHDDFITDATFDNTWLAFDLGGTLTVCKNTVNRVDWVRVGSNNINPW